MLPINPDVGTVDTFIDIILTEVIQTTEKMLHKSFDMMRLPGRGQRRSDGQFDVVAPYSDA